MRTTILFVCFGLPWVFSLVAIAQNWPQAAGPNGDWSVRAGAEDIPSTFSVITGDKVIWSIPMKESGQSGIVVWEDRLFLTILKPFEEELKPGRKAKPKTSSIQALCLDSVSGETIWEVEIDSGAETGYMGGFSDLTSPTPITDGEFVWITNAGGRLVCLNWNGELVWERRWRLENEILQPEKAFPFNKQFEPFVIQDTLVHVQPYDRRDGERKTGWHYLYGLDKKTGAEKWISEDALTQYNTPGYSGDALGRPTALIGRGGYHKVPESPVGYSMIDLEDGRRVWQTIFDGAGDTALSNACFNREFAVWISENDNRLTVLNAADGKILRRIDLQLNVDLRVFDPILDGYVLRENFNLHDLPKSNIYPAWYTNFIDGEHFYFMCFNDDVKQPLMRRWRDLLSLHCFARVNLNTGKVELLEVPVHINDRGDYLWREELKTSGFNSRGQDLISDLRSKRDGWWWCFNGNPIKVNDTLFFTTMIGNCYTFRTTAESFDENAFISLNPLGPRGESWSLNTPSFANGKLYHRTAKELICVGRR